ncbi:hypothetical protein Syun_012051 [Stephania yunnanensis]|uniref:Uncharacterized protein n=1 Tax=Stephania yunnanensis TaxID=152371 RepID=A0AAP0JYW7_9MAGN
MLEFDRAEFWRGNVPALLMVMPYTAIHFTVLLKIRTFASGSSKTANGGILIKRLRQLLDMQILDSESCKGLSAFVHAS